VASKVISSALRGIKKVGEWTGLRYLNYAKPLLRRDYNYVYGFLCSLKTWVCLMWL